MLESKVMKMVRKLPPSVRSIAGTKRSTYLTASVHKPCRTICWRWDTRKYTVVSLDSLHNNKNIIRASNSTNETSIKKKEEEGFTKFLGISVD
jgi:hypothetical protein